LQHVLVEHARNLAGIPDASHAEYGGGGTAVITPLACSLQGREIAVDLVPGSLLARLHESAHATERTTCDYGLEPDMQHLAEEHGMRIAATDDTGEVRAVERPAHPFFVGTLYQPQLSSTPERPHPLFLGLLGAACAAQRPGPGALSGG
jgi:CTP synthase (UTP-ammonia lyase)